jgi:tRNA-dihydrouridine synthase
MGTDDDHLTYLDSGRIAADSGCAAISLHARTAEQLYSGQARWAAIAELKNAVETIPVLGNGDIWEAHDAIQMMEQTGCDGVVVGRGCLGRPWLFADLASAFEGATPAGPPSLGEVGRLMITHFDLLADWAGDHAAVREFRKHTGWYVKGYPVGGDVRGALATMASRSDLATVVSGFDPDLTMTDNGRRAVRGHHGGPRRVSVPDGWFDSADSLDPLSDDAAMAVSGG